MKKVIEAINHHWKDVYVKIEDKDGEKARGIFKRLDWYIQEDYYKKENNIPMLKCFLEPKTDEEKELYPISTDGTYMCVLDTTSMKIIQLDESGNIIQRNIQKFND